ncbi:MAG: ATPase domain-containing protein [Candidatus Bathyarchaeia archaeon]
MPKPSSEKLLPLMEEILSLETKARELYDDCLRTVGDKSVVDVLTWIRKDEVKHIELASEALALIKHGPGYLRIRKGLEGFTDTSSLLLSCEIEDYFKTNMLVLKRLVNERGLKGIYVAVNKPSSSLAEALSREGVDTGKLSFIDCATTDVEAEGVILVKPENLTDISAAISQLVKDIEGEKFVYLDAVSTLYIFNPSNVVERFVHHLIPRLKASKVGLILVAVRDEMERRSLATLTAFCDMKVDM